MSKHPDIICHICGDDFPATDDGQGDLEDHYFFEHSYTTQECLTAGRAARDKAALLKASKKRKKP